MNTKIKIGFAAIAAVFVFSAFATGQTPDDPQKKEVKKHIKMIKVEDGVETELDTIIYSDDDFEWFSKGDLPEGMDSLLQSKMKQYKFQVFDEGDSKHKKFVIVTPGEEECIIHRLEKVCDDSIKCIIKMKHKNAEDLLGEKVFFDDQMMVMPPHPPMPPKPMVKVFQRGNVIDLDDPGIISFKKKDLSGDREKIEIIRKKQAPGEVEIETEVILETPDK